MSSLPVIDTVGSEVGSADLPDRWLEREKGVQALKDTVVAYLAAGRAGTASTRTRTHVRGGGAKPWRQKGTGRARAGSIRSPLWRGGGVIFGPLPRSYAKKVNRKVRRLALRRAFTERVDAGDVRVIDKLQPETHKTGALLKLLREIEVGEHCLIITGSGEHRNLDLASRNLPDVELVSSANVNPYQLLHYRTILLDQQALAELGERLGNHG